jgi:HNH endonuclease
MDCDVLPGGGIIAKCCLTGITGNRVVVTNAHLLPRNAPKHFLQELGINDVDNGVDNIQNNLILCNNIGKAFKQKKLCFVLDDTEERCFILKIWDKEVVHALLFDGDEETRTIGSYSGCKMRFEEGEMPFKRLLSLHAQCSYETAKKKKWITEEEPKPDEYGLPVDNVYIPSFRDMVRQSSTDLTRMGTSSSSDWTSPLAYDGRTTDRQQEPDELDSGTGNNHDGGEEATKRQNRFSLLGLALLFQASGQKKSPVTTVVKRRYDAASRYVPFQESIRLKARRCLARPRTCQKIIRLLAIFQYS